MLLGLFSEDEENDFDELLCERELSSGGGGYCWDEGKASPMLLVLLDTAGNGEEFDDEDDAPVLRVRCCCAAGHDTAARARLMPDKAHDSKREAGA